MQVIGARDDGLEVGGVRRRDDPALGELGHRGAHADIDEGFGPEQDGDRE